MSALLYEFRSTPHSIAKKQICEDKVKIELTKDEALVLFEFLPRFSDDEKLIVEHQAEERALWNLTCLFERELAEPFRNDYDELLEATRKRLSGKD